jgi:spermidine synthase
MFLQWVAGTDAEYKLIARTFLSVFPDATLWGNGSLLLGTTAPLRLRRADFEWKTHSAQLRRALEEFGTQTFEDLLAFYSAGPAELARFAGDGPVLTDDRPLVEYFLSLPRGRDPDLTPLRGDVRRHVVD